MPGRLAAAILLLVGCGFGAPKGSAPGGEAAGPADAGMDVPAAGPCPPAYSYTYNGHKYRMIDTAVSWTDASSNCGSDGGYLLELESQSEDSQAALLINGPPEIWIGLHDPGSSGAYVWTDGTAPAYKHWASTPDAGSPDCVAKNTSLQDGRWYTRDCTLTKPAVCECNPP